MQRVFYIGIHPDSFRAGEPAEIIGVEIITPAGCEPRPCFRILYVDGKEDSVPIYDLDSKNKKPRYRIISENDMHEQYTIKCIPVVFPIS